jgi:hypothetical protein
MRRFAILALFACLAGCSAPRNPYYPDLGELRSQDEFEPSEPDGFLKLLQAVLDAVADKNG